MIQKIKKIFRLSTTENIVNRDENIADDEIQQKDHQRN